MIQMSFAQTTHWTWDPNLYASTMTCTAVVEINGVEQYSDQLEVGAFCGDECRGTIIAMPLQIPSMGVNMYPFFINISGNAGDLIHFRMYDHSQGTEPNLVCQEQLTFAVDASYGELPSIISRRRH